MNMLLCQLRDRIKDPAAKKAAAFEVSSIDKAIDSKGKSIK